MSALRSGHIHQIGQGGTWNGPQCCQCLGQLQVWQRKSGQHRGHRRRALKAVREFAERSWFRRGHGIRASCQDPLKPVDVQTTQPRGQS